MLRGGTIEADDRYCAKILCKNINNNKTHQKLEGLECKIRLLVHKLISKSCIYCTPGEKAPVHSERANLASIGGGV